MKIKVLGTGCKKCQLTQETIDNVIKNHNLNAKTLKIDDVMEIMKYGVMVTPAIVIDEKVVSSGKIPDEKEILSWFE